MSACWPPCGSLSGSAPALGVDSGYARAQAAQRLATPHAQAASSAAALSPAGAGLATANQKLVSAGARATGVAYARLRRLGYRTS